MSDYEDDAESIEDVCRDPVTVASAGSMGESTIMLEELDKAGIPAIVESGSMHLPWSGNMPGEVRIQVPRTQAHEAREVLVLAELVTSNKPSQPVAETVTDLIVNYEPKKGLASSFFFLGFACILGGMLEMTGASSHPENWRLGIGGLGALIFIGSCSLGLGGLLWVGQYSLGWLMALVLVSASLGSLPFLIFRAG